MEYKARLFINQDSDGSSNYKASLNITTSKLTVIGINSVDKFTSIILATAWGRAIVNALDPLNDTAGNRKRKLVSPSTIDDIPS